MADASAARTRAVFEFKSATLPLIAVILKTADLGVLAEGGLLGLITTMLVFLAALIQLWNARLRALAAGHEAAAALCALLMVSIAARLVNGIFLDLTYERYLWLLLAVAGSAAMMRVPERLAIPSPDEVTQSHAYPSFPPTAGD